jgi:Fe-S oxidoreductase
MTTTYDPYHPKYFDESDLREELDRVYDLCHGCRLCFKFCSSFPTMFDYIDADPNQDASTMTPAQQDQVVDECFQCKLCYVNCPYIPGQSEWNLDFPRLMMRADQVLFRTRKRSVGTRLTDLALGRTDLAGTVGSAVAPLANKVVTQPNSPGRKAMEATVGVASQRILPPYSKTRFSTWFSKHHTERLGQDRRGDVLVFATCLVEYQDAQVGRDLVAVYERNGIGCSVPEGQRCCGAPVLHQGDVDGFVKVARKNVAVLTKAIREAKADGQDPAIVVPEPTCGYVLKHDYVDYVGGPDAELVAEHTFDACEYLMAVHKEDKAQGGDGLDTGFTGTTPESTTYHAPCHLRAQNVGLKSRDLIKLTGTRVTLVAECSGIDGTWGLRAENVDAARKVAKKLAAAIEKADSEAVAGDCTLANGGIELETGRTPQHPLSLVARAYGIPQEP